MKVIFDSDIFNGDKSWIYHRKIEKKNSIASWVKHGQSPNVVVKRKYRYREFKNSLRIQISTIFISNNLINFYFLPFYPLQIFSDFSPAYPGPGTIRDHMASSNDIKYILVFYVKEDDLLFLKHYLLLILDDWFGRDFNVNMSIF